MIRERIEDFVGIYEGALSPQDCNSMIAYYKQMESLNLTVDYKRYTNGRSHERRDQTVFMMEPECFYIPQTHPTIELLTKIFWPCYESYVDQFSTLKAAGKHGLTYIRVQKTLPGQGYHQWHFENGSRETAARLVTFMLYLNDVPEGGETEFLYLSKRVQPKAGTLLIWPSGYTHTHRGNPPLKGEKYIVTGWLDLLE